MPKKHTYVLGLNTYDHDVSACLLRDGAIAYAIAKERITRVKHAPGFYKEVIDYCLEAEGITLEDVDLIVSRQKRYSFADPMMRLWVRINADAAPPTEEDIAREVHAYVLNRLPHTESVLAMAGDTGRG